MNTMRRILTVAVAAAIAAAEAAAADVPRAPAFESIPTVSARPLKGADLSDRAKLATFVKAVVERHLKDGPIAGAAVAIVRNGEVILKDGYGLADVANHTKPDADTLFRIGSVAKLFTWTAVMQLVEQELLDEAEDVNLYLGGQPSIPGTFPEPIRLWHLLTHTAGVEANNFGYMAAADKDSQTSLADLVENHVPARVRAPGTLPSYTNWAAAVAGRIIERRSGLAFEDYIAQHIFAPLEMRRSSFHQPLPEGLGPEPIGYKQRGGGFEAQGFEYYRAMGPAGGMTTTAADMANFMRAHLQFGRYGKERILQEETARRMHSRQFASNPYVNGLTYGFMEAYINGRRTIGHQGRTAYFASQVTLLPEENIGLFVVYNSLEGKYFLDALVRSFMDEYFPADRPSVTPPADFASRAARYVGAYNVTTRSYSKSEKVLASTEAMDVVEDDGALLITNLLGSGTTRWVEVDKAHAVFRFEQGDETIAFLPAGDGLATHFVGPSASLSADRIRLVETPGFTLAALALFGAGLAPLSGFLAFGRGLGGASRAPRWLAGATGGTALLILIGTGAIAILAYEEYQLLIALPWHFTAAAGLAVLFVGLAAALTAVAVSGWLSGRWPMRTRVLYTACAFLACAFVGLLWIWNLIGFHPA